MRVFGKTWALPVLFRLYRGKKLCKAEKRQYRKCPQLAMELIGLVARALPERKIIVVGDAAYTNSSIIKGRPSNVTVVGRSRLDAALYAPPPARKRRGRGRPRVKGKRLPSPLARAKRKNAPWKRVQVTVYGKTVKVRVLVIDALWYRAAGSERVRLVVVRDFPGHKRDDVFVSTDPKMKAQRIIEIFAQRWPLETTFFETKGKLGFEESQNRTEKAVERTAPVALWLYSLVVLWYVRTGQRLSPSGDSPGSRAARPANLPWYRSKSAPAFSDMLATLRRASWSERILVPCATASTMRKNAKRLIEQMAA